MTGESAVSEQTLDEFINESHTELRLFFEFWYRRHVEDPVTWPLSMGPGEWFEQFIARTQSAAPQM